MGGTLMICATCATLRHLTFRGGASPLCATAPPAFPPLGGSSGGGAGCGRAEAGQICATSISLTITETLSLHDGESMHWWTWDDQGRGDLEIPERETSRPATLRRGMTSQNPKEVFHSAEGEIEPALHRLAGRIGR